MKKMINEDNFSIIKIGKFTITNREIAEIVNDIISQFYQTSPCIYLSSDREAENVEIRQVYTYMLRTFTHLSFSSIGYIAGRRDRTTAIYACGKVEDYIEVYPEFAKKIDEIYIQIAESIKKLIFDKHEYLPNNLKNESE
jgi:chromosomal replication initiation ATPase DnaA